MDRSLRIAMLPAIKRPITPDTTVSRLRVIADLTRRLIDKGHHVTIFGTADSHFLDARIEGVVPKGLNFMPPSENPFYQHIAWLTMVLETLRAKRGEYDIVHNHMYPEFLPLLASQRIGIPMVTTVHSQMTEETAKALQTFDPDRLVAISESAKKASGMPMRLIHNGIDTDVFVPDADSKREYLLFVGRLSKAKHEDGSFMDPKGVKNAVALARKLDERLMIVGNVEDMAFYDTEIKPYLSDRIRFIGEPTPEQSVSRGEMVRLFQGAKAFVNPINWEEPFGLVMAEAMACGTPVIAFRRGSVPELISDGETGYIVDPEKGIDGLAEAVGKLGAIDRTRCREQSVTRFSITRMADDYERLYREVVAS